MKRYCSSRAEAALAEMQIKGFARRNFHRAQRRRLALPSAEGPFARCRAASPGHVIPTAVASNSFWDSQIVETLTRWLFTSLEQIDGLGCRHYPG